MLQLGFRGLWRGSTKVGVYGMRLHVAIIQIFEVSGFRCLPPITDVELMDSLFEG